MLGQGKLNPIFFTRLPSTYFYHSRIISVLCLLYMCPLLPVSSLGALLIIVHSFIQPIFITSLAQERHYLGNEDTEEIKSDKTSSLK